MSSPSPMPSPDTLFAERVDALVADPFDAPVGHLPALHQRSVPATTGGTVDAYAMLQQAMERGAGLDVIDKMLALAERLDAMRETQRLRQAEASYIGALADLKARVVSVRKSRHVEYATKARDGRPAGSVSYSHAALSDIMEAVAPVAAEVGLTWNYPALEQGDDWVRVTCRLQHVDGYSETLTLGGPLDTSGQKNDLQSIASAMTYLQRYTLKALLGIAEKNDDTDGRPPAEYGRPASRRTDRKPDDAHPEPILEEGSELAVIYSQGEDKALDGLKALMPWWAALSQDHRNLIGERFGILKKNAEAIDRRNAERPE